MPGQLRTTPRQATKRLAHQIITSYTCPRCRHYGQSPRCPRCGWGADDITSGARLPASHDDRVIVC